jgi:hypothetical protein
MTMRPLVLPWSMTALLFVWANVLGAIVARITKGSWGSFLDPVFLLWFALGWFGTALVIRLLARGSGTPRPPA